MWLLSIFEGQGSASVVHELGLKWNIAAAELRLTSGVVVCTLMQLTWRPLRQLSGGEQDGLNKAKWMIYLCPDAWMKIRDHSTAPHPNMLESQEH
jgi:hypothetical protein